MRIQVIAVGNKMPDWVSTGTNEFLRRFPADMPVTFTEIPPGKRGKNADIKRILQKEGDCSQSCGMVRCLVVGVRIVLKVFSHSHNALDFHSRQTEGKKA